MRRRFRILMILCAAWAAAGCGSEIEHDAAVDYTPESLAQELAFRYRDLSPSARKATKNRSEARGKAFEAAEREAQTKGQSKAATKKAEVENIDDVLDEIAAKVRMIRSESPAQTLQKMSAAISRDSSLDEADRQTLAEKLNEMAGAESGAGSGAGANP